AKARLASQAWRFIEFMTRPENAYLNAEYIQYNSPYKSVTRHLIHTRGEEAAWRNLQIGAGGSTVSLMLIPSSQRPEVADAWAARSACSGARAAGARRGRAPAPRLLPLPSKAWPSARATDPRVRRRAFPPPMKTPPASLPAVLHFNPERFRPCCARGACGRSR